MNSNKGGNNATSENLTIKAYEKKVREDIRLIHENMFELLKLFKVEDDKTLKVKRKNTRTNFSNECHLIVSLYFVLKTK